MEKWKSIEPGVWKPEKEGDNIIGVLVNKEPKDENGGLSARYYLENKEGTFFVWGSAVIDDRMQYVKVGQKIRITYGGKTKNKKNQDMNLFEVQVSEGTEPESEPGEKSSDEPEEAEAIEELF